MNYNPTYKEILDRHPGMSYNDIVHKEKMEERRKVISGNPDVILTMPDPTDDEIILALDLKPELAEQMGELPEGVQLVFAMRNNWAVKKTPLSDEQKKRSRYGSLEKIFKDPYDAKAVKWIAWIGIPLLITESIFIIKDLATLNQPIEEYLNGRLYFRLYPLIIGIWSLVFLLRMRRNRRKYGRPSNVLKRELSLYGDPSELTQQINHELTSSETLFIDECAVTENWLISFANFGYPAKVIPLDRIRYIGKFSSPCLVFFDEEINELTTITGTQKYEENIYHLATHIEKKLPDIEFYGYYIDTYHAKAAKFNIEDAKKDGQLYKQGNG